MKKTVSRLALAAAVAGLSTSAMAADLGGSCCADLEERIAELEATTARKGNRVMSLKISGSIGQRIVWHDADGDDARRPDKLTIEDFDDGGDLRFSGSAKLSSDITVGFRMSFDPNDNGDDNVDDLYIYVESKRLGSVFVGRVDSAFDGINRISLADIEDIMLDDAGLDGVGNGPGGYFGDGYFFFEDLDGDDAEGGTIRYVSPTLHGFVFSASYSNDADEADEDTGNTFDGEEIWAVALRYAGEFNGIRIAAGIGYEDQQAAIANAAGEFVDREIVTGSISVMHAPTGLFVNFAAGEREDSNFFGATGTDTLTHYGFVVGVERKFIALGKSTFYGHVNWGEFESTRAGVDDEDGVDWGLGYVQSIDAAASRFNLQYLRKECVDDSACSDDANVLYSGFVVSF